MDERCYWVRERSRRRDPLVVKEGKDNERKKTGGKRKRRVGEEKKLT